MNEPTSQFAGPLGCLVAMLAVPSLLGLLPVVGLVPDAYPSGCREAFAVSLGQQPILADVPDGVYLKPPAGGRCRYGSAVLVQDYENHTLTPVQVVAYYRAAAVRDGWQQVGLQFVATVSARREVGGHQVLLCVDVGDARLRTDGTPDYRVEIGESAENVC